MKTVRQRVFDLLKSWCDRLLLYELREIDTPYLKGGLLCPACGLIHGRCADLVFPLTLLYAETHDEKYLAAAKHLIEWSEYNILCDDGTYRNDPGNPWKGITAFSAMAFGEAVERFGTVLDEQTRKKWYDIYIRLTDSVGHLFAQDNVNPNINYYAGTAALFAQAYHITGQENYRKTAEQWESVCSKHFDPQGLLYGEANYPFRVTEKGCLPIDLCYNLEESLPLLIRHSVWLNDEQKRRWYAEKTLSQLEFLLPDGGIDNSFGTRHNKWTYWGSRTSDGMQEGLVYITDLDPVFARATLKNFELYEHCTHDGALYPGLMAYDAGEPACIHHAFTHAKALAIMFLDMREDDFEGVENAQLPREKADGLHSFQSGNLVTASVGDWRATVNASDYIYLTGAEQTGGSLTLLWHKQYGAVCAATMNRFVTSEPLNMQYQRGSYRTYCMTPRIVWENSSSDCDKTVRLLSGGDANGAWVVAESKQNPNFRIKYQFSVNAVEISLISGQNGTYCLPIIANRGVNITPSPKSVCFDGRLTVTADREISTVCHENKRQYNQVGGFEYFPLEIPLKAYETTTVIIHYRDA